MAVPYVTLNDVLTNVIEQLSFSPDLSEISGIIHDYQVTHSDLLALVLTEPNKNAILKLFTGCVSALNPDVNCYPVGAVDVMCFDADGNPLP